MEVTSQIFTVFNVVKILGIAAFGFFVSLLLTPFWSKILYKYKLGKQIRTDTAFKSLHTEGGPVAAKLHKNKEGTPTMGGVDDYAGILRVGPKGGGLRMSYRILLYVLAGAVGAWWFYFKLDFNTINVPFLGDFTVGMWYMPFFIFFIVATAFSANETDGLDGLAGGVFLTMFAAYGAIAFNQGRMDLVAFIAVIMGALIAFLWFNIFPARFFMGDTGSMSLGVVLGVIAMLTNTPFLLIPIG